MPYIIFWGQGCGEEERPYGIHYILLYCCTLPPVLSRGILIFTINCIAILSPWMVLNAITISVWLSQCVVGLLVLETSLVTSENVKSQVISGNMATIVRWFKSKKSKDIDLAMGQSKISNRLAMGCLCVDFRLVISERDSDTVASQRSFRNKSIKGINIFTSRFGEMVARSRAVCHA